MTIPSYDQFIEPLLRILAGAGDGMSSTEAFEAAADALGVSADQRLLLLPGGYPIYKNRIGWANDRLKRSGLSTSARRGFWQVTPAGRELMGVHPDGLPEAVIAGICAVARDSRASEPHDGLNLDDHQDPASIAGARVAAIYPDLDQRSACLEFAAHVIEGAHAYAPGVWMVNLQRRRVRINVGMLLAVQLSPGQVGLGLVPGALQADLKQVLDEVGDWASPFNTTPVTRFLTLPVSAFREHLDRLRPAFAEFLEIAGTSARQTPWYRAHSPAFVDHLEQAVGRTLPRPEYTVRERGSPTEAAPPERAVAFEGERALFKRVDYELSTLLAYVDMGDIGLPDIQRPFVWPRTKVRDLLDSMFRGFPVGYLLLWESTEPQRGRAIGLGEKSRKVPGRLVVDGQQRLTSLYAVIKGKPVQNEDFERTIIEIAFRPRDAKFEVTTPAIRNDFEWIPNVSDLWSSGRPVRRIIDSFLQKLNAKRTLDTADEDAMSHNIDRLFDLQKYPFTALEILPNIEEEAVADIFVRINSEGKKLDQADFILTLLSVLWDEGRADLEAFARAARTPFGPGGPPSSFNHHIQPSPDQLLRVSIAHGFHRARLKSVYQILRGKDVGTGEITTQRQEAQLEVLRHAQRKTLDLADWHLFLSAISGAGFRSSELISSQTALLYSQAFYLIGKHQCAVDDHVLRRLIGRWFFSTTLTGRYTGSPESVMDSDLARIKAVTSAAGFVGLLEKIIADTLTADYWNITLPNELDSSSARSPALFAYHAAQNRLGAPVLFSDRKIADLLDPSVRAQRKSLERHHLFPRAWLERSGVNSLKLINQTANYAFLEWPDNSRVSDQAPEKYVPAMRERFTTTEWDRMCSLHALPPEWERLPFAEFLVQRRRLMANLIRRGFESLGGGDAVDAHVPADSTAEERRAWELIEQVELALRRLVRSRYDERWGQGADDRFRKSLGDAGWSGIERNREKHERQYPPRTPEDRRDVLDYCYLGQLTQFMTSGDAWGLFTNGFRDKRQLEDLVGAITPVRNDRAHFRHVPERDLARCRVACEDLLAIVT